MIYKHHIHIQDYQETMNVCIKPRGTKEYVCICLCIFMHANRYTLRAQVHPNVHEYTKQSHTGFSCRAFVNGVRLLTKEISVITNHQEPTLLQYITATKCVVESVLQRHFTLTSYDKLQSHSHPMSPALLISTYIHPVYVQMPLGFYKRKHQ